MRKRTRGKEKQEVIQAHERVLDLNNKDALTALEMLIHTTQKNPSPVMPLEEIRADLPAMFRRAAINAALGSARSFFSHLQKWRKRKEKAMAKGKTFTQRPPVPPRTWNKPVPFYVGQWKERTTASILLKVWTGTCWSWLKVRITGRELPADAELGSPSLIKHSDEAVAHLVSARIVQFAHHHGATILVFEHRGNLKPERGRYSRRGNSKRARHG